MNLNGKNVVFVGALGGIGFESCKVLMTRSVGTLAVLDVIENPQAIETLQALNENTKVIYIKCDVSNKESIKKAFAQITSVMDHIDVLVNGAGVVAERNVELAINVNLIGLINMTMEALPYMDQTQHGKGGVIVNIASVYGLEPVAGFAIYSASKFGIVGFTRSLADPLYYNRSGVAVNTLCPGFTDTPLILNPNLTGTFEHSEELMKELLCVPRQPASIVGEHLVQVIEMSKNNSIWISDKGDMRLVEPETIWKL